MGRSGRDCALPRGHPEWVSHITSLQRGAARGVREGSCPGDLLQSHPRRLKQRSLETPRAQQGPGLGENSAELRNAPSTTTGALTHHRPPPPPLQLGWPAHRPGAGREQCKGRGLRLLPAHRRSAEVSGNAPGSLRALLCLRPPPRLLDSPDKLLCLECDIPGGLRSQPGKKPPGRQMTGRLLDTKVPAGYRRWTRWAWPRYSFLWFLEIPASGPTTPGTPPMRGDPVG